MMEFTAEMIAGFLGGQVAGDKEAKVHTVSSIEEGEPGALTYLTNPKYEKHLCVDRIGEQGFHPFGTRDRHLD